MSVRPGAYNDSTAERIFMNLVLRNFYRNFRVADFCGHNQACITDFSHADACAVMPTSVVYSSLRIITRKGIVLSPFRLILRSVLAFVFQWTALLK